MMQQEDQLQVMDQYYDQLGLHYLVPQNPNFFNINSETAIFNDLTTIPNPNNFTTNNNINNNNNNDTSFIYGVQSMSNNSNSTSTDEGDQDQEYQEYQDQDQDDLTVIRERKQRRMISNRESARRSRMRKQRHLDELWSHVVWLRGENHRLVERLGRASETHERVVLENSRLREEASELRRALSELR